MKKKFNAKQNAAKQAAKKAKFDYKLAKQSGKAGLKQKITEQAGKTARVGMLADAMKGSTQNYSEAAVAHYNRAISNVSEKGDSDGGQPTTGTETRAGFRQN